MTDFEQRREWLALLEAELARRTARVELQATEGERAREQILDELQAMAGRMLATAHLYPITIDDMSPAEMLACHFLPEEMQPAGLPSADQIWSGIQARLTAQ